MKAIIQHARGGFAALVLVGLFGLTGCDAAVSTSEKSAFQPAHLTVQPVASPRPVARYDVKDIPVLPDQSSRQMLLLERRQSRLAARW